MVAKSGGFSANFSSAFAQDHICAPNFALRHYYWLIKFAACSQPFKQFLT
jgi:hypothetical protein